MGQSSKIEWTDATLNFWYGCHKVSDGCTHCYMFRDMPRYGHDPNVVTRSKTFYDSLKWAKSSKLKPGSRIFVCSWSDFFIEEADDWRPEAWGIIKQTPQFTYLILTKRVDNILDRLPPDWGEGYPNVWLGPTAENQEQYDIRVPAILQIPAALHFVSMEPMLELIDPCLSIYLKDAPHPEWIIIGAESGAGRRYCNPNDMIKIVGQCKEHGIPVFVKQIHQYGKDKKGLIVSKNSSEWPEDLQIREYPC